KYPEKHKYPTWQNPGRFWNPCRTHFLGLEKRTCPGKRGRLVTLLLPIFCKHLWGPCQLLVIFCPEEMSILDGDVRLSVLSKSDHRYQQQPMAVIICLMLPPLWILLMS